MISQDPKEQTALINKGQSSQEESVFEENENLPLLQGPPRSAKSTNIFQNTVALLHSLLHGHQDNSKTLNRASGDSWIGFLMTLIITNISHGVLLSLYFMISIYKNIQFTYRRVFLKFLTLAYYPNKSPQLIREDVNKLSKIPRRVSCILDLKDEDDENGGIDGLIGNISELAAWAVSAGIPSLTIYEYTGSVNRHIPELVRYVNKNLSTYFGTDSVPVFSVKVPHKNYVFYSNNSANDTSIAKPDNIDIEISLLSRVDGKPTIVELTKTMCELASTNELSSDDITIKLVDDELSELVGLEPDLLIYFGPSLDLQDYPPWHIRLTEIYWEPDNREVNYAVFIRALQRFALSKANVGK